MRRTRATAVLLLSRLLTAAYDPALWELRRPMTVDQPGVLHTVRIPAAIRQKAKSDLADLRLVRGVQEVPFVLEELSGSVRETAVEARIINKAGLPSRATQLTLDAGEGTTHSRVRFRMLGANFRHAVRVETSPDGKQWGVAREEAWVLDFDQDGRKFASLDVDYPASTHRFVRVTIAGWEKPEKITSAALVYRQEIQPVLETLYVGMPAPAPSDREGVSIYLLEAGEGLPSYDRVRLEVEDEAFHRVAEVETSSGGDVWKRAARGVLARHTGYESLSVILGARRDRYLRLRVHDLDDKPLKIKRAALEAPVRLVKFIPREKGEYALVYGNRRAEASRYDLVVLLNRDPAEPRVHLTPGPERPNAGYTGPEGGQPWSERHSEILYLALALAIAVLGYLSARFYARLRKQA